MLSRRRLLELSSLGFGGVALSHLLAQDANGVVEVIDHKICARLDRQKTKRPDLQMSLYAWVAKELFGTDKVALRYQDVVKTKVPKVVMQDIQRASNDEVEAIEAVVGDLELVHIAVSHPNGKRILGRRRSWMCKDCGFRRHCAVDRT